MSDEPEILPPEKTNVPATRDQGANLPAQMPSAPAPVGVVGSWLTGFQAEYEARAYRKIAERIRAQTDVIDAQTGLRESTMRLLSKAGELEDFDKTLALERSERQADRLSRYDKMDYDRDERAHQAALTKLRRERELREARRGIVEADRQLFNSEQGLENQTRLKQLNLEIWEKRAATEHMDAERVRLLLGREVEDIKVPANAGDGTLDQLSELRTSLERRAQEAAAAGDATKAEKYLNLAGELDDMVVAVLQGRGQE